MTLEQITNQFLQGDTKEVLKSLPDKCVNMCVTSPPYWALRTYNVDGQYGQESTPEEYVQNLVEVFSEVKRVLRDDGTLWLNLGDTYAGTGHKGDFNDPKYMDGRNGQQNALNNKITGYKRKDMIGIPWMVAKALQQPYYTGPVNDICDRVWLAAMIDAEGSICGSEYQSSGRSKINIYISITNTSMPVIDKCDRLFPQAVKHIYEKTNGNSARRCFRWDVERIDQKSIFLRTIYPHLVAKRKQAIIAYTFIEMQRGLMSKKNGYLAEQHERRSWSIQALSRLNSGQDVDIPDWCIEPPILTVPGYYLRQDIIWHKPNTMPSPMKDRCVTAHEYIFLLSKKDRYYFDYKAIQELSITNDIRRPYLPGQVDDRGNGHDRRGDGLRNIEPGGEMMRNKRSVWSVNTQPFPDAHFAVFPEKLIEPCILAGCPADGIVLDPFMGSGTTAYVALKNGRNFVGVELNPDYIEMAKKRIELLKYSDENF